MEVKPGYKQTEVGVIPEDWDIQGLLDVVQIASGQIDPKNEPFCSMVLVAPDHIESGSGRLLEKRTAAEQRAISGKYLFDPGDIVYSKIRPYLRKAILADFAGLCSADMYPLKSTEDIHGGYLLPILLAHRFSKYAESVSIRSGMPKINRAELADFSLPVPNISEQRAIATVLSDMDALLDGLDRLIAKKRAIKQAAMQQLLTGQTRLPGFSEEWAVKRLSAVLRFQVGFPFSSVYFNESGNGIRLIKNRDLKADDQVTHYSGEYDSAFLVKYGDVLVGMDGDFLPCLWSKGKALLNQRVGRVIPSKELNSTYAYYRLQEPLKAIEVITSSTTVKHLSHDDVAGIEIPLPCIEEQTAIAEVLSDMDAEITVLEARRTKTHALKQAMMQELLTGRTRLI